MRTWNVFVAITATAVLVAACDAQSDPDYQGERLGTLRGKVLNPQSFDAPSAEVLLLWSVTKGDPDYSIGTTAPVTGQFPAAFTMDLFTPPPDLALNDYSDDGRLPDETRIGVATIVVKDRDVELEASDPVALIGGVSEYLLIYASGDVQAGSFSAELLGGTPTAGYHLMRVTPATCERDCEEEQEVFDQMAPAPDDLDTEVEAVIGAFDAPNWT